MGRRARGGTARDVNVVEGEVPPREEGIDSPDCLGMSVFTGVCRVRVSRPEEWPARGGAAARTAAATRAKAVGEPPTPSAYRPRRCPPETLGRTTWPTRMGPPEA
jgi:hypothetical protein